MPRLKFLIALAAAAGSVAFLTRWLVYEAGGTASHQAAAWPIAGGRPHGPPAPSLPGWVPADEAEGVAAEELVLGIRVDDQARAYSIRWLELSEVVNDRIGEVPIAATW